MGLLRCSSKNDTVRRQASAASTADKLIVVENCFEELKGEVSEMNWLSCSRIELHVKFSVAGSYRLPRESWSMGMLREGLLAVCFAA